MVDQTAQAVRKQSVLSSPRKVLVGNYLTNKGVRLMKLAKTKAEKKYINTKYRKNRYIVNDDVRVVKVITHEIYQEG